MPEVFRVWTVSWRRKKGISVAAALPLRVRGNCLKALFSRKASSGGIHRSMLPLKRVTAQVCGVSSVQEIGGGTGTAWCNDSDAYSLCANIGETPDRSYISEQQGGKGDNLCWCSKQRRRTKNRQPRKEPVGRLEWLAKRLVGMGIDRIWKYPTRRHGDGSAPPTSAGSCGKRTSAASRANWGHYCAGRVCMART